jgi:hypothetical protein
MDEFRLEDFALSPDQVDALHAAYKAKHPPRAESSRAPSKPRRVDGPFLRGPVPMAWLYCAGRAGFRALRVALTLAYLGGMRHGRRHLKGDPDEIPLNLAAEARAWGVPKSSFARGLDALVRAGLVQRYSRAGRPSLVRIHVEKETA